MYDVIMAAIMDGSYKLEEMLGRIRAFAARGMISIEQMDELEELARSHASVKSDTDVFAKLQELEGRIRALESGAAAGTGEAYEAYKAGKWYYAGDKCRENGVNYECIVPEGRVCTWPPSEYPAYWRAV